MTKVISAFNAILTFYILNSQDRRFAQVDENAKAALSQASDELRGKAGEALGITKMFGSAFGFGATAGAGSQRSNVDERKSSDDEFGGFDSPSFPDVGAQQPTWPGTGSGGKA